jgi:hypothetical protein
LINDRASVAEKQRACFDSGQSGCADGRIVIASRGRSNPEKPSTRLDCFVG